MGINIKHLLLTLLGVGIIVAITATLTYFTVCTAGDQFCADIFAQLLPH